MRGERASSDSRTCWPSSGTGAGRGSTTWRRRRMRPGGTSQRHLIDGLGVESMTDLLRVCERRNGTRGAASPLFWTLGGKQVGKAAILGWKEVLAPALRDPELDVKLWP